MITRTIPLGNHRSLHQYRGKASNIYILEDHRIHETILIDCGMPSDSRGLMHTLQGMPPFTRVVCTHFHVDHVSGWIRLKPHFPAGEFWLHESARSLVNGGSAIPMPGFRALKEVLVPCMRESGYLPGIGDLFQGALYGTPFKKDFPEDRVRYFKEGDDVLPGFSAIHTPGHRPDEVSFFDPKNGVLISGDFIIVIHDRLMPNTFLCSPKDQAASLEKIKATPGITLICPGHGNCRPFDYNLA